MTYRLTLTLGFLFGLAIGYALRPPCPRVYGAKDIELFQDNVRERKLSRRDTA
jgi:hypothetical protein